MKILPGCAFSLAGETKTVFWGEVPSQIGTIRVTAEKEAYGDGTYFVFYFENTGSENTPILSKISSVTLSIPFETPFVTPSKGFLPPKPVTLYARDGANVHGHEYGEKSFDLRPGKEESFSSADGTSCQGNLPYFELTYDGEGVIFALGWTGRWQCRVSCTEEGVTVTAGLAEAEFYMKPGEKLRMLSCLFVPYEGSRVDGHNRFRRVMRVRSPLGKHPERTFGRVNISTWGAMPTERMTENIRALKAAGVPAECFFIDAGWHGESPQCPKHEHEGGWWQQSGSWNPNPYFHKDGLKDVSREAHKAGMELLLWFEPERVNSASRIYREHPEWLFGGEPNKLGDYVLDLGNPEALDGIITIISDVVETLSLDWYRQDFNIDTLSQWRAKDSEGRKGIAEIRYILGLYKLYDTLTQRFPHLAIDNCAAGGRRNDIEMMARSVPLWRCDYQGNFDAEPEAAQDQNIAISALLPFSGTGINGGMDDDYAVRSAYTGSFMPHSWFYTVDQPVVPGAALDRAISLINEFIGIRDYFTRDFYPLTEETRSQRAWCVWQYHDPDKDEGCVIAFRRPDSPMTSGRFCLCGLGEGVYSVRISEDKSERNISGCELTQQGIEISLPHPRSSCVIRYSIKETNPDAENGCFLQF